MKRKTWISSLCIGLSLVLASGSLRPATAQENVILRNEEERSWSLINPISGEVRDQGFWDSDLLGSVLGNWSDPAVARMAVLGKAGDTLKMQEVESFRAVAEATLTDGYLVFAGPDFDGSGLSDVAVISDVARGGQRKWTFHLNPFRENEIRSFRWGNLGDVPFVLPEQGQRDSVALLRRGSAAASERIYSAFEVRAGAGAKATFRTVTLSRPLRDIRQINTVRRGANGSFIILRNSRRFWLADETGKILTSGSYIRSSDSVVVGDFTAAPTDDLLIRRERRAYLWNPGNGQTSPVEISEGLLGGSELLLKLPS